MIWGYKTPTNPLVMNSCDVLAKYVGGDYPQIPEKYAASSPIEFVNQQTVPTLIFHGQIDALVFDEHSRRLASKLDPNTMYHIIFFNYRGPHTALITISMVPVDNCPHMQSITS